MLFVIISLLLTFLFTPKSNEKDPIWAIQKNSLQNVSLGIAQN